MSPSQYPLKAAIQDFQYARQQAAVQEILARIHGKSAQLLSYEEVAQKLRLHVRSERGIQQIPLDAIVGSVGRYTDFTRTFLPRRADDQERWARVKEAFIESNAGLPPIEVYKVGEVYFVIDGNHRVSIARQEGLKSIEGRVIEFKTDIKLKPDIQPDDLIIDAEYAEFLEVTRIMDSRPNVDLTVTIPGQYEKMMHEICVEQVLLERERISTVPLHDAVAAWYDNIYIPLAETIRDRGLLRWFRHRTITDLYIWISENRSALEKELGWEIRSEIAATDLILERTLQSEPGSWRKARTVTRYTETLFEDILIPLSGDEGSWDALEQAIIIAQREQARLHGLHIVDSIEDVQSPKALAVQIRFHQTCAEANVEGTLAIECGEIPKKICERATMTDLIVLKIVHPPLGGLSSLQSPFRAVVVNSSRPILAVPAKATHFRRALLAYDGSARAKEAFFVATYLAEMWKTQLIVFTALDDTKAKADVQEYVRRYLDLHEVEAEYMLSEQGAMQDLKSIMEERQVDLLLMGSHSGSTLRQVFIGSELDSMLRESRVPIFICR
jgi:nucleotide-binding universal stress UspA family protein